MPHDLRDQIVDFVRRWSDKTEIGAGRFIGWLGIAASKFYNWRERYGKAAWIVAVRQISSAHAETIKWATGRRSHKTPKGRTAIMKVCAVVAEFQPLRQTRADKISRSGPSASTSCGICVRRPLLRAGAGD